jgi:excisionase family DNA binding protein
MATDTLSTTESNLDRLISLKEAALLLGGVSRRFLYLLSGRGELKLVRLGGRVLVPASEIRRLVSEGAR